MNDGVSSIEGGNVARTTAPVMPTDVTVLGALATEWQQQMVRLAQRYVADREVAQEVVQETWVAVLRGLPTFAGRATLKSWIFAILLNRARTRGKAEQRRRHRLLSIDALVNAEETGDGDYGLHRALRTPEAQVLRDELLDELEAVMAALPLQQRRVLTMHDLEGQSTTAICAQLHLSAANQRVLLHRARQQVRQALYHHWIEDR